MQVRLAGAWGAGRAVAAVAERVERPAREGRVRLFGEDPLPGWAPAVHPAAGVVREDLGDTVAGRVCDRHRAKDRGADVALALTARDRPPAQVKRRWIPPHGPAGKLRAVGLKRMHEAVAAGDDQLVAVVPGQVGKDR